MLINPEAKVDEILGRREQVQAQAPVQEAEPVMTAATAREILIEKKPYFVENARATAAIFRADSPVNRRVTDIAQITALDSEEEESEDLRPTSTTIQYRTTGVQNSIEEGKATSVGAEKRTGLSKREKIIIAVVATVIIALLALVIINSAIISGINSDLSSLQSTLTTVKGTYGGINDQINAFAESIAETVEQFARNNGMVK
ncbi:MAG: hypothetical protein HDP34_02465 [Clostridia bacterium]|nr:hypothetical protein [Clostridia bacterium]